MIPSPEPDTELRRIGEYLLMQEGMGRDAFVAKVTSPVLVISIEQLRRVAGPWTTGKMVVADELETMRARTAVVPVAKRKGDLAPEIFVGRAGGNDVTLPFDGVSKLHAKLLKTTSGWGLTDAGSANGTFLTGRKVAPDQVVALDDGAEIRFGPVDATFFTPEGFYEHLRGLNSMLSRLRKA